MVKNILILLILRLKNLLVFLTIKKTEIPGKKIYKKNRYIIYYIYYIFINIRYLFLDIL